MDLVLSETLGPWPIAWFLRTHPFRPEAGLGSWPAALAVRARGNVGSLQRWGAFL